MIAKSVSYLIVTNLLFLREIKTCLLLKRLTYLDCSFSLLPDSLPPICQRNSLQHSRHTMSGRSGHISGGHTHKGASSHVGHSSERSHASRSSERRPDTRSRHNKSDTHSRHDRNDTHSRHDRNDHKPTSYSLTGRSSLQPTTHVRPSGCDHQSAADRIHPPNSGHKQGHGNPRTHSSYATDNYTGTHRFTNKGYDTGYGDDQNIGRATGIDTGRDTTRKTRAATKRKPGEGDYALHVLIYNEGTDNTCCPSSSTMTNTMNAFSITLSSIAGHWALFIGTRGGSGARIDIVFDNNSRMSNDWTNVMTFREQPTVYVYDPYDFTRSRHHPTSYFVADSVSP